VQCFIVACTPLSGLEWNSVLIGIGIWYQMNPVPADLHATRTRKWSRFMAPVSGGCVMGISFDHKAYRTILDSNASTES